MSSFLKKLFHGKKPGKVNRKIESRRLELLGLEDRITPATISVNGNNEVLIQLVNTESISDLSTTVNGSIITINTIGSAQNTGGGTGLTVNTNNIVVNTGTGGLTGFAGIKLLGVAGVNNQNNVTIGANGIDLSAAPGAANQSLSIDLAQVTIDQDTLNVQGVIKAKGTGSASLSAVFVNIGASGDISTSSGPVAITALDSISTEGDVTTTTGTITYTGDTKLSGNVSINSGSGNVLFAGRLLGNTSGSYGLTADTGSGAFTVNQDIGYKSTLTPPNLPLGYLNITNTNATSQAISLNGTRNDFLSGGVNLSSVGGILIAGTLDAGSVNAKSTGENISFGSDVTTIALGGFTSETTLANKATRIAGVVGVLNGSSAVINGNLVTNHATSAVIDVTATGSITIKGNVIAATAGNDLALGVANGAINISGSVGSDAAPLGDFLANGTQSSTLSAFSVGGAVVAEKVDLNSFGKSVSFAEAVKLSTGGASGLNVTTQGTGTISFAKTIEVTNALAPVTILSDDGAITMNGSVTGRNGIEVWSNGAGNITLGDAISTDQQNGNISIKTNTGNISAKGAITATGNAATITIDTVTSGNITLDGNISTSGGGNINLGPDSSSVTATGNVSLTINGTVSTTGNSTAGSILIAIGGTGGTGSLVINKDITAGDSKATGNILLAAVGTQVNSFSISKGVNISTSGVVQFETLGSNNSISLGSGANVTAEDGVVDVGTGILSLAGNITTTNGDIVLNSSLVNLTGASAMKAGGTSKIINLGTVNGAQNLSLEATGTITLGSTGTTVPLSTVTVMNSFGTTFTGDFFASSVVLADSAIGASIQFQGDSTIISKGLSTTTKGYNVAFGDSLSDTVVIAGTPEFLNLGSVSLRGNVSFPAGGEITAGSTSTVSLGGTIVSGSYFNISSVISTSFENNTQLILNSKAFPSTIVSPIVLNAFGNGSLKLLGVGTLNLSGDSSQGVTAGDAISVINGTLNVTGKLGTASLISMTNGTISGAGGTIGELSTTIGNVTPGGTLKTANIGLGAATNYNVAVVSSTSANNLEVASTATTISLGSAILNLTSVASGLKAGNQVTILNNTSSNPITGTFAGLVEGATVSAKDASGNTVNFKISYKGTDGSTGNDAVLTVTSVVPSQVAPAQPMVAGQPVLNKFMVVGADAGGGPLVTITFPNGTYTSFFAYDSAFTGGVRVAAADVNGDGNLDIVTGAGAGGGPNVKVFQVNELSGAVSLQTNFFAFNAPSFTGGVYVAAGDTNGDGFSDVIVGAGATGGSRVQVYAGSATGLVTGSTLNDFFAYSPAFTGGVVVAAGFRDGDSGQDVVTAPASNGGYNIRSFNCNGTGNTPTLVDNFFAFNNTTAVGGISLALQDLDGTPVDDIIIGSTNSQFGVVLNQTGSSNPNTITVNPFPGFTGAIRAGVAQDANFNYAVAAAGPGGGPLTTVYQVINGVLSQTDSLFVLNPQFTGGLFVSS